MGFVSRFSRNIVVICMEHKLMNGWKDSTYYFIEEIHQPLANSDPCRPVKYCSFSSYWAKQ